MAETCCSPVPESRQKGDRYNGMNTMYRKRMQLSVVAVAALAIVAVAVVMLLAGGAAAQATSAPDSGSGHDRPQQTDPTPTPTPRHATPEPCPEEDGNSNVQAKVVSSGHIALFDVYWNDDEGELTQNPCPPTVTPVPAQDAVDPSPVNPGPG